ncbi:hypothetical protein PENSPDRAFT_670203 [Peniophora sp. CONT]|nr:hypothetical protein PENSPDRAFT_670203 [Peniophora sp. CONT]
MSPQPASSSQPATTGKDPALNDFGKLWEDALRRYKEKTGKDLLELPFAKAFPARPDSADEIMEHLEKQNESFEVFRTSAKKILNVLRPIVDIVLLIKDCAEGASMNRMRYLEARSFLACWECCWR